MARDLDAQKAVGSRLKELREARSPRIRQQAVADHLGISLRAYQFYEAGGTGIADENYDKLAEFFGVSASWLRYGENGKPAAATSNDLAVRVGELTQQVDVLTGQLSLLLDLLARREGFETPEQLLRDLEGEDPPGSDG